MSIQNDLNFLATLAKSFFKQAHIKKTLTAIQEEKITGWEKWLQIELATFLRSHDSVKEWNREIQHALDKRIAKSRSACAIDFVIQQKHKHSNLALEIKQRSSMTACLRGMLRDIKKVGKIKETQFNSRGIWCLGVHDYASREDVVREVVYYSSQHKVAIQEQHVISEPIGKTGFSFTLL